jgi:ferredoxin
MTAQPERRRGANHFVGFRKPSRRTGWTGRCYTGLDLLAPVTRSSPWRRGVQALCLVLFLYAFFVVCWPYAQTFDAATFSDKETYPVETFLLLDPLVGTSTALAGRFVNPATLIWTAAILALCVLIPRGFCGYLCPLGTCIDAFDWLVGRRFRRWHVPENASGAWWVHIKYYLLVGVLAAAVGGVLLSGFVSAIPVLTRGLLFTAGRAQLGLLKGPNHLSPVGGAFYLSVGLFLGVFLLSLRGRRFWCRYVCPSGALLSVMNVLRIGQRQVESSCIHCNRCIEICPFDAIREDFHTRTSDCTYCQTCGGVCPTGAIKFVTRWNQEQRKTVDDPPVQPRFVSRRRFLGTAAATGAGAVLASGTTTSVAGYSEAPLRPPGSVPETLFLELCIRCGECFKVCPGPVLDAAGTQFGWENLWTPIAKPDHAGCHQDCNFCTQVCPTGAIQPLTLEVKRRVHMGLAQVNTETCLPYRGQDRAACNLCHVECQQAGYDAITMREIQIEMDSPPPEGMFSDMELQAMSRILAPVVDPAACVGCGICQYRCHTTYVQQQQRLEHSAIVVRAQNEHRLTSYPDDPALLPAPQSASS